MKQFEVKDANITSSTTHTAKEIIQQPELWAKIWQEIFNEKEDFKTFIEGNFKRIILTGAGTSAYIGMSLKGLLNRKLNIHSEAISTTDIVSHPHNYFYSQEKTLIVSFARSGNSPESLEAVKLADQLNENAFHLIITCNKDGMLAKFQSRNPKKVYILPKEANDQSLAMTSSYSGMLLAGLLIFQIKELEVLKRQLDIVCGYARKIITDFQPMIYKLAQIPFKRAVFLGSGPLYGTAKESQLKLQELTDGKIICKHDSFLGFRHGPKAVIDNETLVVYLFSNNSHVLEYERDLVKAMEQGNKALYEVGIMESDIGTMKLDMTFVLTDDGQQVEEEMLSLCNVILAQMLGFYKSLFFDLSPDKPSVSGAISRVVEGVKIYSLK